MNRRRSSGSGGPLATGLAFFSIGLGLYELLAPRHLTRSLGMRGQEQLVQAYGLREIATGVAILASRDPSPWLWGRVAGDALDLALLLAAGTKRRRRVAGAAAAVAGVAVPDVGEAIRLDRDRAGGGETKVRKAITVNRPAHEVYAFWRDLETLPRFMTHLESVESLDESRSRWRAKAPLGRSVEWEAEVVEERPDELIAWRSLPDADVANAGTVRFREAPGGRGTEVVVELEWSPPGGPLGATVGKLLGEEPATQLADDLRRFKQVLETGEIARSDASPHGHALKQQLRQRPAQPLETAEGGVR